jgi:hypothetical protein
LELFGRRRLAAVRMAEIVMRMIFAAKIAVVVIVLTVVIVRVPALMSVTVMQAQLGMMRFIAVHIGLFIAGLFIATGVNMSVGAILMVVLLVIAMFMAVMFMVMIVMIMGPMLVRLIGPGLIRARSFDHAALDAVAMAAAARVAVARTAAVGTVLGFFLGLTMGALIGFDQRLTVGDRNLIVIRMDFAEGQKAVAVTTVFDEGGLQGRLYARHLGEIDVSTQLLALGGLEIKLFDAIAADHDDPGLFRVGSIDQHFVGHFGALGGGGRVSRCARVARPGDATVHLIRG